MLDVLLSVLYPPRCPLCRRALARPRADGFCRRCDTALLAAPPGCERCAEPHAPSPCARCRTAPPAFSAARACLAYRTRDARCAARQAIARWKYQADLALGAALAARFAAWAREQPGDFDGVVPVPLHRSRLAVRGFHQSAELARAVAHALRRPVSLDLVRVAGDASQTTLGRGSRWRNVRDRFAVRRGARLSGRSVLLVDDVLTTGATADECARALRAAGAERVVVWTLARAGDFLPAFPLPSRTGGDSVALV